VFLKYNNFYQKKCIQKLVFVQKKGVILVKI